MRVIATTPENVAQRWKEKHQRSDGTWGLTCSGDAGVTYKELSQCVTIQEINCVLNDTWTHTTCNGCGERCAALVQLYSGSFCRNCLNKVRMDEAKELLDLWYSNDEKVHPNGWLMKIRLKDVKRSAWANEIKLNNPEIYPAAIDIAISPYLEANIYKTVKHGDKAWAISAVLKGQNTSFILSTKPTRKAAWELCRFMRWKMI